MDKENKYINDAKEKHLKVYKFVQRMPKDNHKRKGNENKRPFIKIPNNL